MDAKGVRNMYSILVVFNKHNTAKVASCWFIIYYIIGKKINLFQSLIIHHPVNVCRGGDVITRTFTPDTRWRYVVFLRSLYFR